MPRINIEDSIYKDHRFIKLCISLGGLDIALGRLIRAWSLAQKCYLSHHGKIPLKEWESAELGDDIIVVGLAELVDGMVRMKGSDAQFRWLKQRQESGKLGGLKTQGNPSSGRQAKSSGRQASSSFSFSNTETKNFICATSVARLCIDSVYQSYPRKRGKAIGLKKLRAMVKTEADLDLVKKALAKYKHHLLINKTDKQFIQMFSTWVNSWQDWLDDDAGDVITQSQVRKIE